MKKTITQTASEDNIKINITSWTRLSKAAGIEGTIAKNRGHFEPVKNRQRYITFTLQKSRSNMAAIAARSKEKHVCYDLLHNLSMHCRHIVRSKKGKRADLKFNPRTFIR